MEDYSPLIKSIFSIPHKLEDLSKEELVSVLENVRATARNLPKYKELSAEAKNQNTFDLSVYKRRHVALKLLYLGWNYAGLASQPNTDETVEAHVFKALMKTKLIESRETSNYHRCGRTDKGVSAFSQVLSLDLRTNLLDGVGVTTPKDYVPNKRKMNNEELDYCLILNRVLPQEIRVVAWSPVAPDFSARFDCIRRTYKYWIPKADLDIEAMNLAAQNLIGEHDFRNLCKMDIKNNVTNFKRRIDKVDIVPVPSYVGGPYEMMEITIVGSAFLWHQIRCIIAVLIYIGQRKEDASVVSQLLDVTSHPQKPQYSMASEIPLVLYDCDYSNVPWSYSENSLTIAVKQLQAMWTLQATKTVIIKRMLDSLGAYVPTKNTSNLVDCLLMGVKSKHYKQLFDRPSCKSLEDRIAHLDKKRKLTLK